MSKNVTSLRKSWVRRRLVNAMSQACDNQVKLNIQNNLKIESDLSCAVSCVESMAVLFRGLNVFSISGAEKIIDFVINIDTIQVVFLYPRRHCISGVDWICAR
jgi:hypothetical protein